MDYEQEKSASYIAVSGRQIFGTIAVGAIAGLISWGLAILIDTYLLKGVFCQTMVNEQCASTGSYAQTISNVLAVAVAVFTMVKLQVFRPLLVGLGAVISLWGIAGTLAVLPWYTAGLISIMVSVVSYLTFMWVARIRLFSMSLVILVVVVAAARLALSS